MSRLALVGVGGGLGPPFDFSALSPALWLQPENVDSLVNNDPVTTWSDISGNARNATQSGALRPSYVTAGINGHPAVSFGTGHYMSGTLGTLGGNASKTLWVVATFAVNQQCAVSLAQGSDTGQIFAVVSYLSQWLLTQWGASWDLQSATSIDTSPHLFTAIKDTDTLTLRLDGAIIAGPTAKSSANITDGSYWLGAQAGYAWGFDGGYLGDVVLVPGAISGSDLASAEANLATRYGITL